MRQRQLALKSFFVLSSDRPGLHPAALWARRVQLILGAHALGLSYRVCHGCYKGDHEQSLLIENSGMDAAAYVLSSAANYNQESILIVGADGRAALFYIQSVTVENIGTWAAVSEREAKRADGFTFDTVSGRFYCVR